ncbi:hypothetical protein FJTKL_06113 [Diaporthe vaccinii]|uniref:Uncharacterized protein n=1 Tax=Diaporthe vaccinii TaxID=105482 RepID=A0ABR4EXW0_9PEZI
MGQHLARTRLAQSNWSPTVSGIRHHEYKSEKGYELGVWAHASPQTDGMKGEERQVSIGGSAIMRRRWEEATVLLLRMSGHTGEFTGRLRPALCFSLTVDSVLAFCLR